MSYPSPSLSCLSVDHIWVFKCAQLRLRDTVSAIGISGEASEGEEGELPSAAERKSLSAATAALLKDLRSRSSVKSVRDICQLTSGVRALRALLPGPVTTQRLCGQDKSIINWPQYAETSYAPILNSLIDKFNFCWPLPGYQLDEDINNFFIVEHCFQFSFEILSVLCRRLKTAEKWQIRGIVALITSYTRSDCLLAAIVDISYMVQDQQINLNTSASNFSQWQQYVQFLMSVPSRVANRLQSELPDEFVPEAYCRYLVFNYCRAIDFMASSCYHVDAAYMVKFNAHLLSKIIVNFNAFCQSKPILDMIGIFVSWTGSMEPLAYLRRRLIQNTLDIITRPAIESLAVMLMQNVRIDYRLKTYHTSPLCNILGRAVCTNKDWEYVLCTKIPLMCHFPAENSLLLENLMVYLSLSIEERDLKKANKLSDLALKLSGAWANKNGLANLPFHQRIYLSQALILSVNYLTHISRFQIEHNYINLIRENLYGGVPLYLESSDPLVRCVGMSTAQLALNTLAMNEPKFENRQMLEFDFSDLGGASQLHQRLKNLTKKCVVDVSYVPSGEDCKFSYPDGDEILRGIALKLFESYDFIPDYTIGKNIDANSEENPRGKIMEQKVTIHSPPTSSGSSAFQITGDLELDSDDDLEPFDMSGDVSDYRIPRPKFLRDLRDCLVETDDPELFAECLDMTEDMVYAQLPNDDSQLAIELLDVLMLLDRRFPVEEFTEKRLSACISVVCVFPEPTAEHICREFHSPVGKYSVNTRLLFLDVLTESAGRLSFSSKSKAEQAKVAKAQSNKPTVKVKEEKPRAEVIRERLMAKTKYYHSRSQHPFAKARRNIYCKVAKSFFYPLLYGFGKHQFTLKGYNMAKDSDNLLLQHYLAAIAMLLVASKNCPDAPKFCQVALELVWTLRYNQDDNIRLGAMSILATAILHVPSAILQATCMEQLMEMKMWLTDSSSTHTSGKMLTDSQAFARAALNLLNNYMIDLNPDLLL